ncbi:hypothetical protein BGZ92_006588 [Podila epicladia]|nr:hypothetical protein BGZ92_006588 [Podila epicladia]
MVIDILQASDRFLAALVGILKNEKGRRQGMRLRAKSPENKRYMRSEMGIIQELANQLLKEQGTVVHPTLGILVRISPQRPQDLNQFAKQLFCGALVPPFLRVAPERFMTDAREFILAVQATKPDALFGWTLRSDSVQITSYSKAEFRVCYVDFNLLNLQVTPLEKGHDETLTIFYSDMMHWMFGK